MGKLVTTKRTRSLSGTHTLSESNRDIEDALDKQADLTDSKTSNSEEKFAKDGTMRITNDGQNYYLEVKTKDGWIVSDNSSASGFKFKKQ